MRRWILLLVAVTALCAGWSGGGAHAAQATVPVEPNVTIAVPATAETTPPLERDLSECISALPPPGCGHAPQASGDRGGWAQWTLFLLMIGGLAFIGWRVLVGVRGKTRDA